MTQRSQSTPDVVLYVTSGCGLCEQARRHLRMLAVSFHEVNVVDDPSRFFRVPVLEVDGVEVAEGDISVLDVTRTLGG